MRFRTAHGRRLLAGLLLALGVSAAVWVGVAFGAGPTSPGQGRGPETYTIGLFGDMAYGSLGRSQYPALLEDINQSNAAFSIFDGDLQAGGDGPCNDSLYTTALANFNTLQRPLIWLPGDNHWTDCWGPRYGPAQQPYHDPIERLNYERQLFDSTNQSLGQHTLSLTRESSEGGPYASYPENVRWIYGPVVYIGLNVQGSNDNYPYHDTDAENPAAPIRTDAEIARQQAEEVQRKAADLHWLDEAFTRRKPRRVQVAPGSHAHARRDESGDSRVLRTGPTYAGTRMNRP